MNKGGAKMNEKIFTNYFSKALKELVAEHKVSVETLANITRATWQDVEEWLAGKSLPGYIALQKMSNYFKVSADQLLDTEYSD